MKDTFWGCFDPILDRFEALFGPKKPSNGPFGDSKEVKKWPERVFSSKMTLEHLGCLNTHSEPVFRLFVAVLRLHLPRTPLEMPYFGIKRGLKKGQKCVFPQVTLATQDAQTYGLGRFVTKKGS